MWQQWVGIPFYFLYSKYTDLDVASEVGTSKKIEHAWEMTNEGGKLGA